MRRRLTIALVGVLVVALVAVGVVLGVGWWRDSHRTDLERAASYAPSDAQRLSWTDWAAVRDELGASLDASSSGDEIGDFLDEGFERDLTSTSALVQSAPGLQAYFGFSPATVDWELFSQSEAGAVVIVSLPDDVDLDDVADQLEQTGFDRPSAEDGVWDGGEELLARMGGDLTPELQYVAIDREDHLVLTSDQQPYLEQTMGSLGETEPSQGLRDVVSGAGEPLSAALYDGPYTCSALAMSHADRSAEQEGEQLVREAGEVNPVTGFAMAAEPGGHVRVVMSFEDDGQARTNADTRAKLASGPAPGQGGDFGDRFEVASTTADGPLVTLDLVPAEGTYVLSDLSTGPVLFATC